MPEEFDPSSLLGRRVRVALDPEEYGNPPAPFVGRVRAVFSAKGAPYNFLIELEKETRIEIMSPPRHHEFLAAREAGRRAPKKRLATKDLITVATGNLVVHFRSSSPLEVRNAIEGRVSKSQPAPAVVVYPEDPHAIEQGRSERSGLIGIGPGWMDLI